MEIRMSEMELLILVAGSAALGIALIYVLYKAMQNRQAQQPQIVYAQQPQQGAATIQGGTYEIASVPGVWL